jgi:hypothetical protein
LRACRSPAAMDDDFDNVGGAHLEAALATLPGNHR